MSGSEVKEVKTRKPRKRVPENESRKDKWARLVTGRSEDLLKQFKLLKNLKASAYEQDPAMEKELFTKFEAALQELKIRWGIDKPVKEKKEEKQSEALQEKEEEYRW